MSSGFWSDRSVLVTGATGLLGGWLCRGLEAKGANLVCVVRDWVPDSLVVRSGQIERFAVVRGDVRERELLERVIGEYEVSVVFHLAAQTIVGVANRNPISTFETNIAGTWSLLEACRSAPTVKGVVVASSDKAYGDQSELPYTEEAPLQGRHPYDASKSCADLITQSYAETFGLRAAITRCGNLYGGGDLNWNRIVPGTIRSILRRERPLIRSDGHFVRDYFYVEDAVAAYMMLAERLVEDEALAGAAFNFSNEEQIDVLQLVELLSKVMNSSLEPEILNEASHEIRHQYLSAAKARSELQWKPLYSLEEGVRKTVDWYRELLEA